MPTTVSFTALQTPFVDLKTGMVNWTWLKILQQWQKQLAGGFDANGNLVGGIDPGVKIAGRDTTMGAVLANIDNGGVVTSEGIDFARNYANQNIDHIADGAGSPLAGGKTAFAALVSSGPVAGQGLVYSGTAWEPHALAQTTPAEAQKWINSYDAGTGSFGQDQPNFADIAGNLGLNQMPGIALSGTVALAKVTTTGANGSITFTAGVITAFTPPT